MADLLAAAAIDAFIKADDDISRSGKVKRPRGDEALTLALSTVSIMNTLVSRLRAAESVIYHT